MKIQDYNRFFAFGDSFTNYYWPTWADILSQDAKEYYNYGNVGIGNNLIFHRFIEALTRHKIDKNDLVIIYWTTHWREDRYIDRWHCLKTGRTAFGIHDRAFEKTLAEPFFKNYVSERGRLLTDLTQITAVKNILDNIGCRYEFLSMAPLDGDKHLESFFADTLSKFKPDCLNAIYKGAWQVGVVCTWKQWTWDDYHPSVVKHLEYLKLCFPDLKLSDNALKFVKHWQELTHSGVPYFTETWSPLLRPDLFGDEIFATK